LHSETHLWEAPGGTPKVQERAVNIESEYDYGSRSGVWRLFRLFNKYNYKYTLYAVGKALEDNPAVGVSSVKNGHDVASHAYRWIDYADMPAEKEKAYIKKEIEAITKVCGAPPKGWYYGRLSSRSHALVWDVYKEMGIPLLWEADSYADDLPYWIDVPAEKGVEKPEGMLMIPYSYGMLPFPISPFPPNITHPKLQTRQPNKKQQIATTTNSTSPQASPAQMISTPT
jgi:peptidoglycan/xylan/chitin deacetylase (PgdA/CDA1 family)